MKKSIFKIIERIEKQEIEIAHYLENPDLKPSIPRVKFWNVPKNTARLLNFFVLSTNAKIILELGCSVGYSALWMSMAAEYTGGHIYTTEKYDPKIKLAKENIKDAGVESIITLIEGDIHDTLKNWNKGQIDMVFLDADKKSYLDYYESVIPFMKTNGILIADNVSNMADTMIPFLERTKTDNRVVNQILDIDNGLSIIYKK